MDPINCPACQHPNEPPFLFCEECGAPRVKIGRLRLTLNLVLAMVAFMATYMLSGMLGWDWPLYSLFAFFLLQFMLALVTGRWRLVGRTLLWGFVFYALSMGLFTLRAFHEDFGFIVQYLAEVPEFAQDQPLIFYPALGGALLAVLIPCLIRWWRIYGWHNALRIVLMTLLAGAGALLLGGRALEYVRDHDLWRDQMIYLNPFVNKAKPRLDYWLSLFALFTFRLLAFEIFVSAALQGYRAAAGARLPDLRERLAGESGFIRSLVMVGQVMRRFLLLLENMVRSLTAALSELARGLWGIARAFARELLTPALALGGAGVLLYLLVAWTRAYIDDNSVLSVLKIAGAVAGILGCTMLFIAALAPFRPERILRFALEFGGWLMPNLLVFFLLMSLSLWLTSRFLNSYADELAGGTLPFRVGVLTWLDIGVLTVLVAVVIWKRRAFFKVEGGGAGEMRNAECGMRNEKDRATGRQGDRANEMRSEGDRGERSQSRVAAMAGAVVRTEKEEPKASGGAPAAKLSKPVAQAVAKVKANDSLLGRLRSAARDTLGGSMRTLSERMAGKPAIVDQVIKLRQQREEKIAQLRSLGKLRQSISGEAHEKLWTETRSELTYLEVELARMQVELDKAYGERLMEKARLEERLAGLHLDGGDEEAMSDERRAHSKAVMVEIEALTHKLEDCERQIAWLAPEAGQTVEETRGL